jgi:hypothetical protein
MLWLQPIEAQQTINAVLHAHSDASLRHALVAQDDTVFVACGRCNRGGDCGASSSISPA